MSRLGKIRVVCATRSTSDAFHTQTALGRSLAFCRYTDVEIRIFDRNTRGLASVYNEALQESIHDPAILVFVHDDVHLCDFFWPQRIAAAVRSFDLIGLAGNKRRLPNQPSWSFVDSTFTWDAFENLSGTVAHGVGYPPSNLTLFGPTGQEVKLLDGVLLAAASPLFHEHHLAFDERFDFHFYDLDICRQFERANLRMGTWPIAIVHESLGNCESEQWREGYKKYLEKWND